jgi:putative ABC transport system substrate-binding protein
MRRREFTALLGGAAAAWSLAAHAQQGERRRRVGVLMNLAADDPQAPLQVAAFMRGLEERGWTAGGNLLLDYRWGAGDSRLYRKFAAELVALAPDVILAVGGTIVGALQQESRSVPIVFVQVTDPVNRGLVASLARPGSNTTGFTLAEFGTSAKWLELLKEIAPSLKRVAVIRDPSQFSGVGQLAAIQTAAPLLGVELNPIDARDENEIERGLTAFARSPNGGMIVPPQGAAFRHRALIIVLAARHRLPAIYAFRYFVTDGGLISYGPDAVEPFRSAAGYVDRILRGAKPADLPVQAPVKLELVINLKTAKALGIEVPDKLLAIADEVIE